VARVLISALGTGPLDKDVSQRIYKTAHYKFFDNNESYETPFVAAALSQHMEVDKMLLVGTGKSMWEEVYSYFSLNSQQEVDETYWMDLGQKVAEYYRGGSRVSEDFLAPVNESMDGYLRHLRPGVKGGSRCYLIEYGLNEEELWRNFDIFMQIAAGLEEGDEIYLDITHSFRSIPLFMYLMLDFIKTLNTKQIEIGGIYYGMFEAKGEFDGYTPVVDLGPLFKISQWIKGAYDFITYGNGYMIASLLDDKEMAEKVRDVSELVNINYITDLKREVDSLDNYLQGSMSRLPVLKYLSPYFEDFVGRFRGINSNGAFQFRLARWYFENRRYASGYICLAESIITRTLELYRDDGAKISVTVSGRDKIKNLIKYHFWKQPDGSAIRHIYDEYMKISKIRNRIAHAGFSDKSLFAEDINNVDRHLKAVEKLFSSKELQKVSAIIPLNS